MNATNTYRWNIEPIPSESYPLANVVSKWHLDAPTNGSAGGQTPEIAIKGWALGAKGKHQDLHVVFRTKEGTWSYPLTGERPDVVRKILKNKPTGHKELVCGLLRSFPKRLFDNGISLGLGTDGITHQAITFQLVPRA